MLSKACMQPPVVQGINGEPQVEPTSTQQALPVDPKPLPHVDRGGEGNNGDAILMLDDSCRSPSSPVCQMTFPYCSCWIPAVLHARSDGGA